MMRPDLTPAPRRGDPLCGYKPTPGTPPCHQPATWHILWHLTPEPEQSLACNPHMAWTQERFPYLDRHPATINCDMPGTGWKLGPNSTCTVPDTPGETDRE
jgi:hypothetical protein